MSTEELIEKAVENLNRVKQLNLKITGILSQLGNDNNFSVSILDNESDCTFDTIIDENISTQQLLPDDPISLSPDNIIMLRIAKCIFEAYKKFKTKLNGDSLTLKAGDVLTINSDQTIGAVSWSNTTYDINLNGKSLTTTIDEVDELKNKVKDLEDLNYRLTNDLDCLKAILKVKGVL